MSEFIIECEYDFDDGWIPVEHREEIVRCNCCKYYDERAAGEVYANHHWCDKLALYMPPNGFCSFGKRRWLTCKCGERIENTDGGFVVCPSCGRKVKAGD